MAKAKAKAKREIDEHTDAEVGARVRKMAAQFEASQENDVMAAVACAQIMAGLASRLGGMAEIKVGDLTDKGKPAGDWIVTVKKV